MKLLGHVFLLAVALLVFDLSNNVAEGSCGSTAWFGPNCEYKCHCSPNNCNPDGTCMFGAKCDKGWFGPGCQYLNQLGKIGPVSYSTYLNDDDDNTCGGDSRLEFDKREASVQLFVPYRFTWMRIATRNRGLDILNDMIIKFDEGLTECKNMKVAVVSPTLLDIHCDMSGLVKTVRFKGPGVQSLCGLYISGGRNLAILQNTTQSSTLADNPPTDSSIAVDGENKPRYQYVSKGECTSTADDGSDGSPTWSVTLSQPATVYTYYAFTGFNSTQDRCCEARIRNAELRAFDEEGEEVFSYINEEEQDWTSQSFYAIPPKNTTAVSKISITATYTDNTTTPYPILTLCEVEVFGDSVCPEGRYGRDCEHECNCANDEPCFVSTGGCPSGCAEGFYGEDCKARCPVGYYGDGCTQKCSDGCVAGLCNNTDGTCDCKLGRTGARCEEHCPPGKYSVDCTIDCSSRCGRDGSCHPENGKCTYGCVSGYMGLYCLEGCSPIMYGKDCSEHCSNYCDRSGLGYSDRPCDRFNGTCLKGCKPGSDVQGPLCEPLNAAGRVFSSAALLMTVLGALLVYRASY